MTAQPTRRPDALTDPSEAHYIRERQWDTLERIAEQNPLYICWWNNNLGHDDQGELPGYLGACSLTDPELMDRMGVGLGLPPDLRVFNLVDGRHVLQWLNEHPDWTRIGAWSDERLAAPVWITDAGRAALADRRRRCGLEPKPATA